MQSTKYNLKLIIATTLVIFHLLNNTSLHSQDFKLSPAQTEQVQKLDNLYAKMKSIKTRFIQTDAQNNVANGWFILQKPGLARIEYDDMPIRFIANANSLMIQDKEMNQKSFFPMSASPFGFLLQNNFSFLNPTLQIIGYKEDQGSIIIEFVNKENTAIGSLTLHLEKTTANIIKWVVTDATGLQTEIKLYEPIFSTQIFSSKTIFNVQKIKDVAYKDITLKSQ